MSLSAWENLTKEVEKWPMVEAAGVFLACYFIFYRLESRGNVYSAWQTLLRTLNFRYVPYLGIATSSTKCDFAVNVRLEAFGCCNAWMFLANSASYTISYTTACNSISWLCCRLTGSPFHPANRFCMVGSEMTFVHCLSITLWGGLFLFIFVLSGEPLISRWRPVRYFPDTEFCTFFSGHVPIISLNGKCH